MPRFASNITSVQNGLAIALNHCTELASSRGKRSWIPLQNMTDPGQWLASIRVTLMDTFGDSSIFVGVSRGIGFYQHGQHISIAQKARVEVPEFEKERRTSVSAPLISL